VYFTGLGFFALTALFLIDLVRRRKIKEKMALYWSSIPILVLIFAINPFATASLAHHLGFSLVSNFLLVSVTLLLIILTLHLSAVIGKLEDRTNVLAEEVAILRGERKKYLD
jgi:hypothetical protein